MLRSTAPGRDGFRGLMFPERDESGGVSRGDFFVALSRFTGTVGSDATDLLTRWDLVQQFSQHNRRHTQN